MKIEQTQCDREQCTHNDAKTFYLFKERKLDGAGSSEDWHYMFDLCSNCADVFLKKILDSRELIFNGLKNEDVLKIVTQLRIKHRLG